MKKNTQLESRSKTIFIFLIFSMAIFMLSFVQSAPPIKSISTPQGLEISYPAPSYFIIGTNLSVRFWVYNVSNGVVLTNATTNCTFNLMDDTSLSKIGNIGKNIFRISDIRTGGLGGTSVCQNCFNLEIAGGNFSKQGIYAYQIRCQNPTSNIGGYFSGEFNVNPRGDDTDTIFLFSYIIFIIATIGLFSTLLMGIAKLVTTDTTIYDVCLSWSFLILMMIAQHLSVDLLTYDLSRTFMTIATFTNGLLPLISLTISIFVKSTQKKRVLTPAEIGGRFGG